ncbi:MAG: GYD domain-containing protein [Candidatus Limnocylindrales bacterium]
MPKYLLRASYTQAGAQGLIKDGGSKRLEVIRAAAASVGGSVEAAYWAFGEDDFVGIFDLPGNAEAAAVSLTVSASGAVGTKTTVLMTAADVDAAVKLHPSYRPPGA